MSDRWRQHGWLRICSPDTAIHHACQGGPAGPGTGPSWTTKWTTLDQRTKKRHNPLPIQHYFLFTQKGPKTPVLANKIRTVHRHARRVNPYEVQRTEFPSATNPPPVRRTGLPARSSSRSGWRRLGLAGALCGAMTAGHAQAMDAWDSSGQFRLSGSFMSAVAWAPTIDRWSRMDGGPCPCSGIHRPHPRQINDGRG